MIKVEIWSDVMCPFCYIGKRRFEAALAQFDQKEQVEIVWKSFQLNPDLETDPSKNINEYLAEIKGIPLATAQQMNDRVTLMAKESGLTYNFDKAVVANSFDAHRFSHLAKKYGKQIEAEEQLFKAYFTDGKNTADHAILIELGTEIGIPAEETKKMLDSDLYAGDVQHDIYESQVLGVRGVPFFVFDRKYAVTGAQDIAVFSNVLETINKENLVALNTKVGN